MYPIGQVYSHKAYVAWRNGETELKPHRQEWRAIRDAEPWRVNHWDELRLGVSFLTLMNKRSVLYFRGQRQHYKKCLPALFRSQWFLNGNTEPFQLSSQSRLRYYELLRDKLRTAVYRVVNTIGTPRRYIIETLPAATASVLQHYELWPTPFIDLTRSLPTAVAFATAHATTGKSYLYVFAMPDLRGSITTDMDQHMVLSRLEAVCPPAAKRPHHQDAYLVARAPEPHNINDQHLWADWEKKSDLMRRLVAKFELVHGTPPFSGVPVVPHDHLIPPIESDPFLEILTTQLRPMIVGLIGQIADEKGDGVKPKPNIPC